MYFLFDIGGTKMRFALATTNGDLGEVIIVPTPNNFSEALGEVSKALNHFEAGGKLVAAAGGVAGIFDPSRSKLLRAPHLPGWADQPLAQIIGDQLGCPLFLENDAALAGLGEAVRGAGRGKELVAYLTVSTGVGGARIEHGQIDEHHTSFEPGHQIIDWREPEKHLEDYVSGSAVSRLTGQHPAEIKDPNFWQELSQKLAVGLHNSILHWTPELVILGGSMMHNPGINLTEIDAWLEKALAGWALKPELKLAELGEKGGLLGALTFLKQKFVL